MRHTAHDKKQPPPSRRNRSLCNPTAATRGTATPARRSPGAAAPSSCTRFGRSSIFLVEDIERREANVSDFFFAKREFVTRPTTGDFAASVVARLLRMRLLQ